MLSDRLWRQWKPILLFTIGLGLFFTFLGAAFLWVKQVLPAFPCLAVGGFALWVVGHAWNERRRLRKEIPPGSELDLEYRAH